MEVIPKCPANAAPSADPTAAISSSAWKVLIPNRLCFESSCKMSEAGVIGYEPRKMGRFASWPAATKPHANAVLPVTLVYSPGGSRAGATMHCQELAS